MERRECPECGNRTYNEVCDICGERIEKDGDMTEQTQVETGWKWATPQIRNYGRLYVFRKSRIVWAAMMVLFVLIPLLIAGAEQVSWNEVLAHFRYDKAGTGTAVDLPAVKAQRLCKINGITVRVNSFGMLDGEQVLAITAVNRSFRDAVISIDHVEVNGCTIDRPASFSERSREVKKGRVVRFYLELGSEEISDLGIDTVEEITVILGVHGQEKKEENRLQSYWTQTVDASIKTSAYSADGYQ